MSTRRRMMMKRLGEVDPLTYSYNASAGTATVTACHQAHTGEVVIPSVVEQGGVSYMVTTIGANAFNNCKLITRVTIPNGVTRIEQSAFASCYKLLSVSMPSSVTYIGAYAFLNCNALSDFALPARLQYLGDAAMCATNITSVVIPDTITTIPSECFSSCQSLSSVEWGGGVTTIGYNAFSYCYELVIDSLPETLVRIEESGLMEIGNNFITTIPASVEYIGNYAMEDYYGGYTELTILRTASKVEIGEYAFTDGVTVRVPRALLSAYQADPMYSNYTLVGY